MKRICATLSLAVLLAGAVAVQAPPVQAATPSNDFCKKWYKYICTKPAKRAMALSTDGKVPA